MAIDSINLYWYLGGAIALLVVIAGWRDLLRFSSSRIWAISNIVFTEAVRKRVLWIAVLAMAGTLAVSQFQNPADEQDAIRQTIKFCVLAAALVTSMAAVILTCTHLPREIETRVIYTVVTKPTTRLEIVLGKTLGFARVSGVLLLIMGLLSWAYLQARSSYFQRRLAASLQQDTSDNSTHAVRRHYLQAGLLHAKTYASAVDLQCFSRIPITGEKQHWLLGASDQDLIVPFHLDAQRDALAGRNGFYVAANFGYQRLGNQPHMPTVGPNTTSAALTFTVYNRNREDLVQPQMMDDPAHPQTTPDPRQRLPVSIPIPPPASGKPAIIYISPEHAQRMLEEGEIYVQVEGRNGYEYSAGDGCVELWIRDQADNRLNRIFPTGSPIFRGRYGNTGRQIHGNSNGTGVVARFAFNNVPVPDGNLPIELNIGLERESIMQLEKDEPTRLQLLVVNRGSGKSYPQEITPEPFRTNFYHLSAEAVAGGNFDVMLRCLSDKQWVSLIPDSVRLVTANHPFAENMAKGLLILWLFSILITAAALLSSTFLSWPIAIMLTVLLLTGRWTVNQMGNLGGIGQQVVSDLGLSDPGASKVVSTTVNNLTRSVQNLASVLPDLAGFSGTENVEQGTNIPWVQLGHAVRSLAEFGLPMVLLAYLILRGKEVAP